MSEQLSNNAQTVVTSGLANVTNPVTFVVASAAAFPTLGNFRVLVEAEILLVTAVVGTSFTASRAQEGSSAASHANGTAVTQVLTAGGLRQFILEDAASGHGLVALSYGPTIGIPDAAVADWFTVGVTNGAAHAFPAPINATTGKEIALTVFNLFGAIATATFHATYKTGGYVVPGFGLFSSAVFKWSGADWYQVTPWTPGIAG